MAAVSVLNVSVLDNPPTGSPFNTPLKFEITFECGQPLAGDLEWRVVYVGSAKSNEHDQELESVLVGPVPVGTSRFVLETRAPDASKVPADDLLGATIVMITCLYQGKQFVRVGYWVSNTYTEPLGQDEKPPQPCPPEKVSRIILADKPTVTKWPIQWI